MKIKTIKAKNFLSIGPDGIEIDFSKYGNIVLVKGQNLDVSPQSSNGAGKSTIIEVIVYGFYGKMIKGLSHKEALNKKTKKNLEIEIVFEVNSELFRLVRHRKSATVGTLELYNLSKSDPKDASKPLNVTVGGMPDTQKLIEELIKLSAESFINVVCLGEHNNHAFLSLEAKDRRAIVENLLGLEKYVKYNKQASVMKNAMESEQKIALKKYDTLVAQHKGIEDRITQLNSKLNTWISQRDIEISAIKDAIVKKNKELEECSDNGMALLEFNQAQSKIKDNQDEIKKLELNRVKLSDVLEKELNPSIFEVSEYRQSSMLSLNDLKHNVEKLEIERKGIEDQNVKLSSLKDGIKCFNCLGTIDKKNYEAVKLQNKNKVDSLNSKIELEKSKITVAEKKHKDIEDKLTKLKSSKISGDQKLALVTKRISELVGEISELSKIKEPSLNSKEIQINEQIKALDARLTSKINDVNPYEDIIDSALKELEKSNEDVSTCKNDIDERAALLPYYEYWVVGFGDKGIRSFIIDEKLPALNSRINYWLQFLIENKLQLKFDKEFEPTIERNPPDGDPFVYSATSGGERRRINISISQAFSYITMMSADIFVNLMSLDEVAINVDLQGIHGIYKMINELARDRQVLVTTHDPNLLDLLENCDVIKVVKDNGFTRLATPQELAAA